MMALAILDVLPAPAPILGGGAVVAGLVLALAAVLPRPAVLEAALVIEI